MEIIVPAAGLSTRFPNSRPKYLLFDYEHNIMLRNAVAPFIKNNSVTIGILKEHADKHNAIEYIKNELPSIGIVVLDEPTKGPADTVYQIIRRMNKGDNFEFLVKDCDSFFNHSYKKGNYVCTSRIDQHEVLKKLHAKSFVQYNEQEIITNIIEKNVVSDTFCVGGYKFESSHKYIESFSKLSERTTELFVSHVIQDLIMNGSTFVINPVFDYTDVGTLQDWVEYNDVPVIFCDIDGTLVKAQNRYGENTYNDSPIVLQQNVDVIKKYVERGSQVIFTTARPKEFCEVTKRMLESLGFSNPYLICGIHSSRRILINDYNETNPHPRATAVNIYRDSDTLKDYL